MQRAGERKQNNGWVHRKPCRLDESIQLVGFLCFGRFQAVAGVSLSFGDLLDEIIRGGGTWN